MILPSYQVIFARRGKAKKKNLGPCTPVRNIRTLTMAGSIEQRPWTPTVRIGRIAAETSNPGPAIVQLPTLIGELQEEIRLVVYYLHECL